MKDNKHCKCHIVGENLRGELKKLSSKKLKLKITLPVTNFFRNY